jgi:L-rhamnose-H+ transport protein
MPEAFGFAIVIFGGLLHGSFAFPMKRIEGRWSWENIWLLYSIVGLAILPPFLALFTVPALGQIYRSIPFSTIALVALFGVGWGAGSVLFGQAISRVGMALGFAIILGITSTLGSLLPLAVQHPEDIWTPKGRMLLLGLAIAVVGISICSAAGAMRDRDTRRQDPTATGGRFVTGLVISILSGIFSPMLNFGFVYGEPLQTAARGMGAQANLASNAIWAPALLGGFLVNAGYAVYLLNRNRTWKLYSNGRPNPSDWIGCAIMGLFWFGGISIYGMGAASLGRLGPVAGWPVFMSTVILTANILGFLSGEWRGARTGARVTEWVGIAFLVAAILVVSRVS